MLQRGIANRRVPGQPRRHPHRCLPGRTRPPQRPADCTRTRGKRQHPILLPARGRGTVTTTISGAIPATAAFISDRLAARRATASSDAIRRATRDASSRLEFAVDIGAQNIGIQVVFSHFRPSRCGASATTLASPECDASAASRLTRLMTVPWARRSSLPTSS